MIGAVLVPGALCPRLVSREMVKNMMPGSVMVDVAIDQGGCIETIDHPTTHDMPTYIEHGVVHYAVANMPGAVSRTSTIALTNWILTYVEMLAKKGWKNSIHDDSALAKGVNILEGRVTYEAIAQAHNLKFAPL
jgi:alanine dehydrogenase